MGIHRIKTILAFSCIWFTSTVAQAQLTSREAEGVQEALFLSNLTINDLTYERVIFPDTDRMPIINLAIEKPLDGSDAMLRLHNQARASGMSEFIATGRAELVQSRSSSPPAPYVAPELMGGLPPELSGPVNALIQAVVRARAEVRFALRELSDLEQRQLLESIPIYAVEEPKVTFGFSRTAPLSFEATLALVHKVDLDKILQAGESLSQAIERAMSQLRGQKIELPIPIITKVGGISVEVTGRGNDIHTGYGQNLIIDLGGDDTYSGRIGGGVLDACVAIDLSGSDRYDLTDVSGGAGLLGIGILRDVGGSDQYKTDSINLGSGIVGVGAFAKEGGSDDYRSTSLAQGFGFFGIGLHIDTFGNDRYDVALMGQGCSRTRAVGWLIDRAGDDTYRAGGLSLNSPLFSDVHYSWAQGCSSGFRLDTGGSSGGVGMLTDIAGDDAYIGETYCQAASYWFGIGSLYDASGHDTYSAYHYAQSSAMHACAAFLFDLKGDDAYLTRFGACFAIGHDYAVAFLLDRAGNDVYASRDGRMATGNANGIGIFVDSDGDDRYPGSGGRGNASRGTGSVGLFVDLGGQDIYAQGQEDGEAIVGTTWGIAVDRESSPGGVKATNPPATFPTPGSLSKPTEVELEKIYSKATQWAVGTAQVEAQENVARLVGIGMPALEWMLSKKLETSDRLGNRVFVQVIRQIGEPGRLALVGQLLSSNENILRNALTIAIDGGIEEAGAALPGLIARPSTSRLAIRAAGAIKSVGSVGALLPLCASSNESVATLAMISLSQIQSADAYSTAEALLTSRKLPIRKAALSLVALFPLQAIETAKRLMSDSDERVARIGVELLGAVGTPEALKEIGQRLTDPSYGIRIEAVLALAGKCPAEFRQAFMILRDDPIPAVRMVARRLNP